MKTKVCKYCRSKIQKKAKICPYCRKHVSRTFGKLFVDAIIMILIIFVGLPLLASSSDSDNDDKDMLEDSEKSIEETVKKSEKETTFNIEIETEPVIDMEILSEEEYKNNCVQIYYEDIQDDKVTKSDYVKIEIYLEQVLIRDPYEAMADKLWQDNTLSLTYHAFGASCRDYENNYGGENYLLFPKNIGLDATNYSTGNYFYVYGKVLEVSTNGWTGHKILYLIPKYIDNK